MSRTASHKTTKMKKNSLLTSCGD